MSHGFARAKGLLAAMLLTATCSAARGADLYVICNSGVSLAATDVRDVFLGEKQFAGPVKLLPADNSAAQSAFLSKVLKLSAAKYSTAWTKKSFRDGANPPPIEGSDAEALAYVKRTLGGCSYLSTPVSGPELVIVSKF